MPNYFLRNTYSKALVDERGNIYSIPFPLADGGWQEYNSETPSTTASLSVVHASQSANVYSVATGVSAFGNFPNTQLIVRRAGNTVLKLNIGDKPFSIIFPTPLVVNEENIKAIVVVSTSVTCAVTLWGFDVYREAIEGR